METVGHQLASAVPAGTYLTLVTPLRYMYAQSTICPADLLVPSTGSSNLVPRVYSVLAVGTAARVSRRGPRPKLECTWHGDR